jgi:hypothetical protein
MAAASASAKAQRRGSRSRVPPTRRSHSARAIAPTGALPAIPTATSRSPQIKILGGPAPTAMPERSNRLCISKRLVCTPRRAPRIRRGPRLRGRVCGSGWRGRWRAVDECFHANAQRALRPDRDESASGRRAAAGRDAARAGADRCDRIWAKARAGERCSGPTLTAWRTCASVMGACRNAASTGCSNSATSRSHQLSVETPAPLSVL